VSFPCAASFNQEGIPGLCDFTEHDEYAIDKEAQGRKEDDDGNAREDFIHHSSHVIPKTGLACQALKPLTKQIQTGMDRDCQDKGKR
jgi:hypothetical protein